MSYDIDIEAPPTSSEHTFAARFIDRFQPEYTFSLRRESRLSISGERLVTASDEGVLRTLAHFGPESLREQVLEASYARLAELEDNDEDRTLRAARHARRDRNIASRPL